MVNRLLAIVIVSVFVLFSSSVFAEDGVKDNQILVGMSTVLSGPASFLGTSFRTGTETYIKKINEEGGVNGRKIKLIAYDRNIPITLCPSLSPVFFTNTSYHWCKDESLRKAIYIIIRH